MIELNLLVGIVGMVFILMAFIDDLFKKITEDNVSYNLLNIAGGLALAYYAYSLSSLPFMILQLFWVLSSAYKLLTLYQKSASEKA